MHSILSSDHEKARLKQWLPITLILLLASFLYFFELGERSLWLDEIFSLRDAEKYLSDFPSNFSFNRPLYFVLLHFWMKFGESEAWLRSLSVLFGLGSVFLTYILGCRLYSKATGLISAVLLTLSPLVINHSQEVRMYMMSTCLGVVGSVMLTYLLETPKVPYLVSWLGLRFLAVLTTPISLLLLPADLLLLGYQLRHRFFRLKFFKKWLWLSGILLIPAMLILPDIFSPLLDFFKGKTEHFSPPNLVHFVGGLTKFTVWPLNAPWTSQELPWLYRYYDHFLQLYAVVLMCLLIVALCKRKVSSKYFWSALWGFFPTVTIFLLSQIVPGVWGLARYLLVAAPYILLLVAEGFLRIFHWRRRVAFLVIVIYMMAVGSSLSYYYAYYPELQRENWRDLAQIININEDNNDAIIMFPSYISSALELRYYYKGSAPISTIEPTLGNQPYDITQVDVERAFNRVSPEKKRFWLVLRLYNPAIFQQQRQIFEKFIEEQYEVQKYEEFGRTDLYLLTPNSDDK